MTTLHLAINFQSCGVLRAKMRPGDRVISLLYEIVGRPLPTEAEEKDFFSSGNLAATTPELVHWAPPLYEKSGREIKNTLDLEEISENNEDIEIYLESTPNSILKTAQCTAFLLRNPRFRARLTLNLLHISPENSEMVEIERVSVDEKKSVLLRELWAAIRSKNPVPLYQMLSVAGEIHEIFEKNIRKILEDFPSVENGLSRTEAVILSLIEKGYCTHRMLFAELHNRRDALPTDYWLIGSIIASFGNCHDKILDGVPGGQFNLSMHDDRAAYTTWMNGEWKLTETGRSIIEGKIDLSACHEINRWVGGVHLTNDALWRWDARSEKLLSPIDWQPKQ